MISADTTIAHVLEQYPQLVDLLAAYHPHFEKLRDAGLRGVMAPRVTVAEAARIAGVAPDELLAALRRAAGEPAAAASPPARASAATRPEAPGGPAGPPSPDSRRVEVDVREDIRRGEEPFARIMAAVKALGADETLVLRVPFEPVPLYGVLARRGFAHRAERHAEDDWSVSFYRTGSGPAAGERGPAAAPPPAKVIILDVRGLEPPAPMLVVLERLDTLGPDERLEVIHARRPMFLYPQLEDRGFVHETDEPEPGMVRITIRRGAPRVGP